MAQTTLRSVPLLAATLTLALAGAAHADQGSFTNSGGSTSAASGVSISTSVASPAGSLTLNCPAVSPGNCAGGQFTYRANDGTMAIDAAFTTGAFAETCSGGGKGGHITCSYTFTGSVAGTLTLNGATQAIVGATSQIFGTGGAAARGATAFNSAYTPFYYSDSEQILRSDDLRGTNQIAFGTQGSGVGQFYGAEGIALDAAGRIYVADTYNCRVVRIDDMNGTNWTEYGGVCGAGQGQFADPSAIALDALGRVYVLDAGNCRIVRIDDLSGTNWIAYGSMGAGTGQFSQYLTSLAIDGADRVYVADTGNRRLVRVDDMTGANWTTLTQSVPIGGVSYSFQSPVAVSLDAAGRIYVGDNESYQPAVIRVDDMTGAGWTQIYTGAIGGIHSVAVDAAGSVFLGGGGVHLVDGMTAVMNSSGAIAPFGSYYVFGVTPIPVPHPIPSAIGIAPATLTFSQIAGTSASQTVAIENFGGSPLNLGTMSAPAPFTAASDCPGALPPGGRCSVLVTYAPSVPGSVTGSLSIADDSGNSGAVQTVALTGTAMPPVRCQDTLTLGYSGTTLSVGFTIETSTPATWSTSVTFGDFTVPLWSIQIPAVSPPVSFTIPFANVPHVGTLSFTTVLTSSQTSCQDTRSIDTGP